MTPKQIMEHGLQIGEDCFAVATIVRTAGTTSAKPGAKALMRADGTILEGWLGGGCVRGAIKNATLRAYANGQPDLGRPLLDHRQLDTRWSIRVSVMEEFVRKSILSREQFQTFKQSWKDPNDFICVFVADPQQAAFVYFPYPVAEGGDEI